MLAVVGMAFLKLIDMALEKFLENVFRNSGIIRAFILSLLLVVLLVLEEAFYGYIGDYIRPGLFDSDPPAAVSGAVVSGGREDSGTGTREPDTQTGETDPPSDTEAPSGQTPPAPDPEPDPEPPAPAPEPTPEPEPDPDPGPDPLSLLEDITGQTSVSGSVVEKGQADQYRYTAPTDGTYCFDSGQGYGALFLQIDNAYGGKLSRSSISVSVDLEAGKTYILNVEYGSKPLDYTVQIGVPNPVTDITGQTSVSGSFTYLSQADRYTYTAPVSGVYRFDAANISFGSIELKILNAQGGKVANGSTSMVATLEAGKVYTLSVEATHTLRDYTVQFCLPNPAADITASAAASGTLTFVGQRDQYYYTPPEDGTYCFDSGVTYGGVSIAVHDENGSSCGVASNALTVSLKAGTRYVLDIYKEYATLPMDYTISVSRQE